MSRIQSFATRYPVRTYIALTFAISWGGGLLAIGSGGAMRGTTPASDPRFASALMAMLAGPSVTGILMTWLTAGRAGVRELFSRAVRWRVDVASYAIALLTAPVVMVATLLTLSSSSPAFLPAIFTPQDMGSRLLVGLGIGLAAGLLEELGWTGFATRLLVRRRSVLATGVIVGVWWSAWHLLPNVWSARAASGDLAVPVYLAAVMFGVFVGYLTAFRVLIVCMYDRTESVLVGMLMHGSLTASLLILNPVGIAGAHLLTYSFALAGVLWILAAVVVLTHSRDVLASTPAAGDTSTRRRSGCCPAPRCRW